MVYVDKPKHKYRNMLMCHMVADSIEELHHMADVIGVDRKHFQNRKTFPHYDICKTKRNIAIKNGAIPFDSTKDMLKKVKYAFI